VDGKELRALSRATLRSYARYWLEVFRLPVIPAERIVSGMHVNPTGEEALEYLKNGRGVIFALPHMGNFEQAGVDHRARGRLVHHRRRTPQARVGLPDAVPPVPAGPGHGGAAADRRPAARSASWRSGCGPASWSAWSATGT
jgi:hypothetical protein